LVDFSSSGNSESDLEKPGIIKREKNDNQFNDKKHKQNFKIPDTAIYQKEIDNNNFP